jgi:hypothetical protein
MNNNVLVDRKEDKCKIMIGEEIAYLDKRELTKLIEYLRKTRVDINLYTEKTNG